MAEGRFIDLPALPATLTHAQAEAYLAQCRRALASAPAGAAVALDAAAVRVFDSSALAVLLALRREVLARGGAWHVRRLPERLQALAQVYGVAELLPT